MIPGFLITVTHAATISTSIPGTNANGTSSSPGAFIGNFYQFALIIAGVLAFGVIVYGGIRYMTSAGNPSGASDAKEWIEAALLGLLLLTGAYFILKVVNPQLVNLNLPKLTAATVATTTTAGTPSSTNQGVCGGTTFGTCAVGVCQNYGRSGYQCNTLATPPTAPNPQAACSSANPQGLCPAGKTCQNYGRSGYQCN